MYSRLFLYNYLYNHTDDEHTLTTQDLLRILDENGFQANRATLKKDVDLLIDSGYDIIAEKEGKFNAYHYGAREFDFIQLQMLVDAVTSARFLSDKKSQELTERLSSFTSIFQREKLEARIRATECVRSDNPNVFIISDQITRAIDVNRMIEFQYYDYAGEKKSCEMRERYTGLVLMLLYGMMTDIICLGFLIKGINQWLFVWTGCAFQPF